ncbi:hydroxymethylglutaryl-CoA synthase [Limosilactobacillus fastidiosus]|uniref:Hydroxymethylglutaryl-CoA synthase n=1 Tax=Limosilactobacillus fastidiosus TaxID=2759855 RepID=A0A7W3U0Y3_9LACO|nr:hydroxymethylglutaryl-CoA synthase [Limosilactobacillus fastidiosus]MBB1062287.1 hydroxymethylglutaryl-CoA synthase [Limosilactobacillus fastidiosus]MBB1086645.1 hydroxymethylglutaryl-CoA synthase [Limosilactobacillus fastidiosus]MCD7083364.1 hydroxymethylglutaryl-CoA synthase [Limosilactobacillus fastidiosus]MCD7086377.1 hydroxymethylglutaryl-CoA synthase [Limosilactobacillus fastidiosus]MCD7115328.1 hydroxymethylglutaryl-CoA synthase [Limosilactobacillus fastidiosus]
MKIGIDKMAFATTDEYIDLRELARKRGDEPDKYTIGIGQDRQAVVPASQDIVTLGASAAEKLLTDDDKKHLSTIIVATESGIDNSKASAIYVKHLLGLDDFVRTVELKEACYSATAGIQFAKGLVTMDPQSAVLVIASDIARYGLETSGEVTQGAGAVAMLITANPHVLALEDTTVSYTKDLMDFWRPLYATEAHVDGKYSTNVYIEFFLQCWQRYRQLTGRQLADFAALAFHLPFTKMGKKALEGLLQDDHSLIAEKMREQLTASQKYCREVGNLYTGSLYLGLMSLLQNGQVKAGDRIGLFSYGSGAEGEFYSGILQAGFEKYLSNVKAELADRHQVSIEEYERQFNSQLGMNSDDIKLDWEKDPAPFVLKGQKNYKRFYGKGEN